MPVIVKLYVSAVIVAGALISGFAASSWQCQEPLTYVAVLGLALATSFVKLRLPGIDGSYSLNFLFILLCITRFSLAETLLVGCSAALVESVFLVKKRPAPVQIAFNLANVAISIGACFGIAYGPLAATMQSSPSIALTLIAAVFFFVNTVLVSGVLALLSKQSLKETCSEWYLWAFPYYLAGAALVGVVPLDGGAVRSDLWLALVPALYLIHFFWALSKGLGSHLEKIEASQPEDMPAAARSFVWTVMTAGVGLLVWSIAHWSVPDTLPFLAYLLAIVLASAVKVWLPGLTGTISLSFVVLLSACSQLSFSEVVLLSALAAAVQSLWHPEVRPMAIQVGFNAGVLALGTAAAYAMTGGRHASSADLTLYASLGMAALALYTVNTILVSTVCCLVAQRSLRTIWQSFCFWTMPYYLVGAAFSGLIASSPDDQSTTILLALPLLALIGVSYRIHLSRAQQASSWTVAERS